MGGRNILPLFINLPDLNRPPLTIMIKVLSAPGRFVQCRVAVDLPCDKRSLSLAEATQGSRYRWTSWISRGSCRGALNQAWRCRALATDSNNYS